MNDALRLFLIEDDDDIALLIRRSLERAEHRVQRCRTGADALIVLAQAPFDLVVLDWRLPDMNGLELLDQLAGDGITVPVLMITGQGDETPAASPGRGPRLPSRRRWGDPPPRSPGRRSPGCWSRACPRLRAARRSAS